MSQNLTDNWQMGEILADNWHLQPSPPPIQTLLDGWPTLSIAYLTYLQN